MLLDTNVYSALILGHKSAVEAIGTSTDLKIPLPVVAELRYGFIKGSRPEHNEQVLQRFLAQEHVSIAVPVLKTTMYYAQLQLFCMRRGRVLSHNDIWIAALASEADDTLITYDHDFEVLSQSPGLKLMILDKS